MNQFADPEFLQEGYGTEDGLAIRIQAQQWFSRSHRNRFDELTRDAMTVWQPNASLNIGAGTGA
ncbi:MAG: hypothetical protein M0Z53_01965 [Thermaerobacter sp.]|nr:hypothetical protein [Thermaerobacter sp.]